MEGKFLIGLLVLGLVSTALAKGGRKRHHDRHEDDDIKCTPPVMSDELPLTCTVTDHCGTYTCSADFEGEAVTLSLKFDRSQESLSAEIILKVPGRDFEWKHTFKNGDKFQVEGFPLSSIKGIGNADMYLMLTMDKYTKGMSFKLDLYVTSEIENMEVPLLQGKLPMKHEYDNDDHDHHHRGRCSRLASWFKRQPGSVKAAVVISTILVFALIITGLVYCCKKRKAPVADVLKVKPPSYDEVTTTKTKVPLEPLVNEED